MDSKLINEEIIAVLTAVAAILSSPTKIMRKVTRSDKEIRMRNANRRRNGLSTAANIRKSDKWKLANRG